MVGDHKVDGAKSKPVSLTSGIPQGSVLGPILFTLYTYPLWDLCQGHELDFQLYADDQHIYIIFKPVKKGSQKDSTSHIEKKCIEDVHSWMGVTMLKLNDDKTEFIIFGIYQQLAKVSELSIKSGSEPIPLIEHVRELGYQMDNYLMCTKYINKLVYCSGPSMTSTL